jgi:UDP-N-acetylglucosamine 2-epimerase (non-hydrolysing)
MSALDRSVEHTLIHTGQNYAYELNEIFFDQLKLRHPDVLIKGACHHTGRANTAIETIGTIMDKLETYFHAYPPDAMLILGDTNSSLAAAYVAKRLKIPLFHMQAGNRSFDENLPEEINRRMIDHIADINMPYSSIARENLLREGLLSERIIKTGSPMYEVLCHYFTKIVVSDVLIRMKLEKKNYFVISCHREATLDSPENFSKFTLLLTTLGEHFKKRIIVSAHPRLSKALGTARFSSPYIEMYKPFGLFDYMKLQKEAFVTLSDSGTITEDASILKFPALNLRESTERPEGMEEGVLMMTGLNISRIMKCIPIARSSLASRPVAAYNVTDVSNKVVRILMSYTDYVNRTVWRKNV